MLNPTCCIRLATSSNTVQHRPTMLDSTMLDDAGSVWPGLYSHDYIYLSTDKPEITTHPQSVTTKEGDNVTLSCYATGNPVPAISWIKDGFPISNNSRISLSQDNNQLTMTNVKRTDSGEYQCVASNRVGKDTSNASTVNILCK